MYTNAYGFQMIHARKYQNFVLMLILPLYYMIQTPERMIAQLQKLQRDQHAKLEDFANVEMYKRNR